MDIYNDECCICGQKCVGSFEYAISKGPSGAEQMNKMCKDCHVKQVLKRRYKHDGVRE